MRGDAKYLGFPSFWAKSKSEAYIFIVEKALKKMQGWISKRLNQAGKETMLKSVLQSQPTPWPVFCYQRNSVISWIVLFETYGEWKS